MGVGRVDQADGGTGSRRFGPVVLLRTLLSDVAEVVLTLSWEPLECRASISGRCSRTAEADCGASGVSIRPIKGRGAVELGLWCCCALYSAMLPRLF